MALVRAVHLGALMLVFGGTTFPALLRWHLPHVPPAAGHCRVLLIVACFVALVSALVSLPITAAMIENQWSAAHDPQVLRAVLLHTEFGRILIARLTGLIVLIALCAATWRPAISCVIAGLLLAGVAATSHAAASAGLAIPRATGIANDALHLLAGAFWLGGLAVLLRLFRVAAEADLLGSLRLFSNWGMFVVALIAVTGTINAALVLSTGNAPWNGTYARLLAAKITLAAVMIAIAAANRWRLLPASDSGPTEIPRALARNIALELLIGLMIVAIAAVLGTIAPM